jgi:GNAT superfamily N-acetyltransferase
MISIRKAEKKDIPVLITFQQRLAHESEGVKLDALILDKGMQAMFQDPSKGFYNIAENAEGEIVGCHMVTYEWSDWRNGWVYWLQSVYVVESHRKLGVFRTMYENLIGTIKNDQGIIGLRLYVDKSNIRAQQVYTAMGMNGEHYTVFEWMKDS